MESKGRHKSLSELTLDILDISSVMSRVKFADAIRI